MSCLEAGVPHGPGRSLLPPEDIKALSFWAVTGGGAGWGQSTVLGQWAQWTGSLPPLPPPPLPREASC